MAKRDKIIKELYAWDERWRTIQDELRSKIKLSYELSRLDYRVYCKLRHTVQAEVARSGELTKYSDSWKDRVGV